MILKDIRDLIATFEIAEDAHCYMGKLDNKHDESIGVYHLRRNGSQAIPIGGMENSSYTEYPVSILVHWNRSPTDTEIASKRLYEALEKVKNIQVNEETIKFCKLLVPEPQDVGTDEQSIFEMVIEVLFYCERRK